MPHNLTARSLAQGKAVAKTALQAATGRGLPVVVIASMGRMGSTLVYQAACEAMARRSVLGATLGRRVVSDTAWELTSTRLRPGVVYKTHDLPPRNTHGAHMKAVFLFGPASDSALSVIACEQRYGAGWVREHFEHMHATGTTADLQRSDVLGFRTQIESWATPLPYPVMLLHYDAIWEYQSVLARFLGVPIVLPPRRRRSPPMIDDDTERQVRAVFQELDSWIDRLPRCRIVPVDDED